MRRRYSRGRRRVSYARRRRSVRGMRLGYRM